MQFFARTASLLTFRPLTDCKVKTRWIVFILVNGIKMNIDFLLSVDFRRKIFTMDSKVNSLEKITAYKLHRAGIEHNSLIKFCSK